MPASLRKGIVDEAVVLTPDIIVAGHEVDRLVRPLDGLLAMAAGKLQLSHGIEVSGLIRVSGEHFIEVGGGFIQVAQGAAGQPGCGVAGIVGIRISLDHGLDKIPCDFKPSIMLLDESGLAQRRKKVVGQPRRTVGKNEVVDVDFHPKLQVIALIVRTHKTNSFCDTLVVYAFGELQRQWNSRMLLQHPFDERFGLYSSTCVLVKWSPRGSYLLTRESGCLVDNKLARLRFYKFDACLGRVLKIVGSGMTVHSYSATKNLWLNERDVILPSPSGTTDLPRLLSLSDDGLSMSIIEPKPPDNPDPIEFPLLFLTAVSASLSGMSPTVLKRKGL